MEIEMNYFSKIFQYLNGIYLASGRPSKIIYFRSSRLFHCGNISNGGQFWCKLFHLTMRKIKVCFLSFPFCKRKGDFESAKDVHFYFYRLEQRHFGAETDFCKTIAGSDQPSLYILCSKKSFFSANFGIVAKPYK